MSLSSAQINQHINDGKSLTIKEENKFELHLGNKTYSVTTDGNGKAESVTRTNPDYSILDIIKTKLANFFGTSNNARALEYFKQADDTPLTMVKNQNATKIQAATKGFLVREKLKLTNETATKMQVAFKETGMPDVIRCLHNLIHQKDKQELFSSFAALKDMAVPEYKNSFQLYHTEDGNVKYSFNMDDGSTFTFGQADNKNLQIISDELRTNRNANIIAKTCESIFDKIENKNDAANMHMLSYAKTIFDSLIAEHNIDFKEDNKIFQAAEIFILHGVIPQFLNIKKPNNHVGKISLEETVKNGLLANNFSVVDHSSQECNQVVNNKLTEIESDKLNHTMNEIVDRHLLDTTSRIFTSKEISYKVRSIFYDMTDLLPNFKEDEPKEIISPVANSV